MLFRKCPTKQLKHSVLLQNMSTGMAISEELLDKHLETHGEHDFVGRRETTGSNNLISFNTDECVVEGGFDNSIDSKASCGAAINKAGNIGERPHDGDFLAVVEPVESIHSSSGIEIVSCEILDVSVRNKVVRDCRSQDNQSLELPSQNCNDGVLEFVHTENSRQTDLSFQVGDDKGILLCEMEKWKCLLELYTLQEYGIVSYEYVNVNYCAFAVKFVPYKPAVMLKYLEEQGCPQDFAWVGASIGSMSF